MIQHFEKYKDQHYLCPTVQDCKYREQIAAGIAMAKMLKLNGVGDGCRVGIIKRVAHPSIAGRYLLMAEYGIAGMPRDYDDRDQVFDVIKIVYLDHIPDHIKPFGLKFLAPTLDCTYLGEAGGFAGIMMTGTIDCVPARSTLMQKDLPFIQEWQNG